MNGALDVVLVSITLALALICALWALRGRPAPLWQLIAAGAVELVVLAVVIAAAVATARGNGADETVTGIGYLIAMPLVLPFGVLIALIERTRYGSTVLAVTAFVVAVLVFRLRQLFGVLYD